MCYCDAMIKVWTDIWAADEQSANMLNVGLDRWPILMDDENNVGLSPQQLMNIGVGQDMLDMYEPPAMIHQLPYSCLLHVFTSANATMLPSYNYYFILRAITSCRHTQCFHMTCETVMRFVAQYLLKQQ